MKKLGKRLLNVVSSRWFLLCWATYALIGVIGNAWERDVTFTVVNVFFVVINLALFIRMNKPPQPYQIVVASGLRKEVLADLDDHLVRMVQKLNQEPTAELMTEVIHDLRKIVGELG